MSIRYYYIKKCDFFLWKDPVSYHRFPLSNHSDNHIIQVYTKAQNKLQTDYDYFINFVTQLHEIWTQASENLITAKEKSKIYHDIKTNHLEIKIENDVFLLKEKNLKR